MYYGKPLHNGNASKSPDQLASGKWWGEHTVTPVRLSTDNKMRSICNVDKRGEEKIGNGRKRKTISRGDYRGDICTKRVVRIRDSLWTGRGS